MEVDPIDAVIRETCVICKSHVSKKDLRLRHVAKTNEVGYVCKACCKTNETTDPQNHIPSGDVTL